jgi:ABC-type transport system substrate-binding protein
MLAVWLRRPLSLGTEGDCVWYHGRMLTHCCTTPPRTFFQASNTGESQAYASQASWNEASWKNARFDELLLLARAETDTEKRQAMYSEMQKICSDDGGVIIPIFH